ncbi:MAG: C-terminal binding protein [Pseudomonas sp.]|uniref:C-terminal binding protein n=1 Tax=Pseudomonas sp. TaxID=306 RepID=UPI003D6ED63E
MSRQYKIGIIDPQFSDDLSLEQSVAGELAQVLTFRPEELELRASELSELDGIVHCRSRNKLGAGLIAQMQNVKVVVQAGVGTDHIDISACSRRKIPVCNVPDYGTREIADHAIALMLTLRRGIAAYDEQIRQGSWSPFALTGATIRRICGQTLGIVGLGSIGMAVALRAKAFGMRVMFHDPFAAPGQDLALGLEKAPSFDALLSASDVISLHCPLTTSTRHLINAQTIGRCRAGAVIINTSRGEVVDLDALHDGLRSGQLSGAGLDVLPSEPADRDHPLIAAWASREPWLDGRLLLTPHAAFFSPESVEDLRRLAITTVVDFLRDGTLRACINQREC